MYLRLHQDQIDKEHNQIMLNIFVGESLASGTLRQAHISTPTSGGSRGEMLWRILPCYGRDWGCLLSFGILGRRALVRFVAAVEDVVELGDWIAAFDADGHAMSMIASLLDAFSNDAFNPHFYMANCHGAGRESRCFSLSGRESFGELCRKVEAN